MRTLLTIATILILASTAFAASEPLSPPPLQPPPPPPPLITDAWARVVGPDILFALFWANEPDYTHDSFQWFLSLNEREAEPMVPSRADFIVRSDDMANGNVKICSAHPFGAGCPGGWGLDLGNIPTQWDGDFLELTFSAPIALFGDSTMAFAVMSLEDGAQHDVLRGIVMTDQPVQLPLQPVQPQDPVQTSEASSLWLAGIAGIGLVGLKRRIQ